MDVNAIVKVIERRTPLPPKPRACHGKWIVPAWTVRGLVEKSWGVSDAVRRVVTEFNFRPEDEAYRGIRAAYYAIRRLPWSKCPTVDLEDEQL